jgi:hypothetical protein
MCHFAVIYEARYHIWTLERVGFFCDPGACIKCIVLVEHCLGEAHLGILGAEFKY